MNEGLKQVLMAVAGIEQLLNNDTMAGINLSHADWTELDNYITENSDEMLLLHHRNTLIEEALFDIRNQLLGHE